MIQAEAVTKSYRDLTALDGASVTLPAGALTALVGPTGAGKSTLLSVIGRLVQADSGRVRVGGLDVVSADSRALAKQLAVLRQDNHFSARLTVVELARLGRFPHCGGRLGAQDHAAVARALDLTGTAALADRFLDELSGGQRQRACVAMVFAQDTPYVLLDEPLNSLDLRHATALMGLLREACDTLGKTVAVVIHDVNYASAYADLVVAMRSGRVVAAGPPRDLIRADLLSDLYDTPVRVIDADGWPLAVYHRA
ncbi:MAG: ATP-binding cassette domain-containing protein [Bifidobacteriaceae bacterium]|jgi:iron complex transport system ATP-binding protein|nr:ATP-binding cassette domain-containing protein [Bifidobacteriaceae bacterium]